MRAAGGAARSAGAPAPAPSCSLPWTPNHTRNVAAPASTTATPISRGVFSVAAKAGLCAGAPGSARSRPEHGRDEHEHPDHDGELHDEEVLEHLREPRRTSWIDGPSQCPRPSSANLSVR